MADKEYTIINMRTDRAKLAPEINRSAQLCYQINTTDPTSPKIKELLKELFHGHVADDASFMPPLFVVSLLPPNPSTGVYLAYQQKRK
ncbi:hypothetical protein QPX96_09385 [Limosilactobacillus fermentum]|nr:hypothetical protein [Limosilactobacillus fermentum]